ncbi:MAG: FHA domain-containing protein [Myxococcales bacterium]|nr:FHA domain-containing protein [Myxococcales bacterium]MCB9534116.1 FHA domain-containing protein [Myxococcales bacterium]
MPRAAAPVPRAAAPSPRHETPAPQVAVGQIKLVVEQGRILGEQFLLNEREVILGRYDAGSGRCPDIDLTAQDPAYVHRQHVRLAFSRGGDQLMMYDLGGRNGSYLNNQLLEKNGSALVQLGDKLRVGRVVLRVQAVPLPDDDRTPK